MSTPHLHFVTGKLAQNSLRQVVSSCAGQLQFEWTIEVLPITVAALMTPAWIAKRISIPAEATRVVIPGYCSGNLEPIEQVTELPVERGPKDLRQLPHYLGHPSSLDDFGDFDIEIISEINHCPRLSLSDILNQAQTLARDGADIIDLGCDPEGPWQGVGETVRAVRDLGLRVSIDSWHPEEVAVATAAGAELVLSVNSTNCQSAAAWNCEVVAVPDAPNDLASLFRTAETLDKLRVPYRLDPILEPIGLGFAAS